MGGESAKPIRQAAPPFFRCAESLNVDADGLGLKPCLGAPTTEALPGVAESLLGGRARGAQACRKLGLAAARRSRPSWPAKKSSHPWARGDTPACTPSLAHENAVIDGKSAPEEQARIRRNEDVAAQSPPHGQAGAGAACLL